MTENDAEGLGVGEATMTLYLTHTASSIIFRVRREAFYYN
jgi:hypothetical protein